MKKIIALLLACLLLFGLAACDKSDSNAADDKEPTPASESEQTPNNEKTPEPAPDGESTPEPALDGESTPEPTPDGESTPENSNENTTEDGVVTHETLDELNSISGAKIAPPQNVELTDEYFETVATDESVIAQYLFLAGEVPCGLRFTADFDADISEVYDEDGNMLFADTKGDETSAFEYGIAAHWETVDGQYVLVVTSDDEEFFNGLLDEMKASTIPGES